MERDTRGLTDLVIGILFVDAVKEKPGPGRAAHAVAVHVEIDGESHQVEYEQLDANLFSIILDGKSLTIGTFKSGKQI